MVLPFLGSDDLLVACLASKEPYPVLGFVSGCFFTFLLGLVTGFFLTLRWPMFNASGATGCCKRSKKNDSPRML